MQEMQNLIKKVCDEIKEFLLEKNKAYGNSAAEPVRIFSKSDSLEQINVRIDDKLSRMMKGNKYPGDDDELDLIGYLILKRVVKQFQSQPELNENRYTKVEQVHHECLSKKEEFSKCFGNYGNYETCETCILGRKCFFKKKLKENQPELNKKEVFDGEASYIQADKKIIYHNL